MDKAVTLKGLDAILDQDAGPVFIVLSDFDANAVRVTLQRRPILLVHVAGEALSTVIQALEPQVGACIERLVQIDDLIIGDELQQVLDCGLYNPRLVQLFEMLWAARFERTEGRDPTAVLAELRRITFEEPLPLVTSDILLFWLTLFRQNGLVGSDVILTIYSAPGFDSTLWTFIRAAEQWQPLGSPLRIVTNAIN